MKMRESGRAMLFAGVVFFALGTLLFVVSERITVQVELMPFSLMLIFVLVAGAVLFGSGLLMYLIDRHWNA
jgi:predicted membrane channel-forming protein YqfA (hemolysin III family)